MKTTGRRKPDYFPALPATPEKNMSFSRMGHLKT
jgi:hypothetical protein